jgi:hypothetical protein
LCEPEREPPHGSAFRRSDTLKARASCSCMPRLRRQSAALESAARPRHSEQHEPLPLPMPLHSRQGHEWAIRYPLEPIAGHQTFEPSTFPSRMIDCHSPPARSRAQLRLWRRFPLQRSPNAQGWRQNSSYPSSARARYAWLHSRSREIRYRVFERVYLTRPREQTQLSTSGVCLVGRQ